MGTLGFQTPEHILYKYNHLWTLKILEELVLVPLADVPSRDFFELELSAKGRKTTLYELPLRAAWKEVRKKRIWVEEQALKINPLDGAHYPGGDLYNQIRFVLQKTAPFPVGNEPDKYPIHQRCQFLAWASWYMGVRASWAKAGQQMLEKAREHMARFAYWLPVEDKRVNPWDERKKKYYEHKELQDDLLRELITDQKEYLDFFAFERGIQEEALFT